MTAEQMVWHPAEHSPKQEGRYLCALRATKVKPPRVDFCYYTNEFGWANRYVTHWMHIPRNPNG